MEEFISQLKEQYSKALPFVAYNGPNEAIVKGVFQSTNDLHLVKDFNESGFVFAPFNNNDDVILIPFDEQIEVLYDSSSEKVSTVETLSISEDLEVKKQHELRVNKGVDSIKSGDLEKVVLSRKLHVDTKHDPIKLFENLLALYSRAFVYIWYHPKVGCWLGATPEVLLKIRGVHFSTMALAGTQLYADNLTWGNKEQQEQQLVTDFITDAISQLNVSFKQGVPYTVKAGNLAHIRTDIEGRFSERAQLNVGDLIGQLHPTPAVCGMPKQLSKAFILANEGYNREYYTGYLGELNKEKVRGRNRRNTENSAYRLGVKESQLYVNLRCMKYDNQSVSIYVGGGITKDSNPTSEYEETTNKSKTMLRALV